MIAELPPREGTLARQVFDHVLASPVPLSRRQVCDWFLTATDHAYLSVRNTYGALARLGAWQRYTDKNGGVYHGRPGLRFCAAAAAQDARRRHYGTRTGVIARVYAVPREAAPVREIDPADYRPANGSQPMAAAATEPQDRTALRGLIRSLLPHTNNLPADVRLHVQRGLDTLGDLSR
ncbi:MAG: hypothetical protein ACK51F_10515 [Rhodospirillales bacterium]